MFRLFGMHYSYGFATIECCVTPRCFEDRLNIRELFSNKRSLKENVL